MKERIMNFLFSSKKSYVDRPFNEKASKEDIYNCFRLILGRPPSEREWHGHSKLSGRPLKDVVATYVDSKEFKNRKLSQDSSLDSIEEVQLANFKMYVPKDDPQVGIHIIEDKTYEGDITYYIEKNLFPGDYFIDLGANIGYYSMLSASLVGNDGKVFSFEPGEYNCKFLLINKNLNKFDNIYMYPLAAANGNNVLLYDSSGSNGFIGNIGEDISRVFESKIILSTKVDDICASAHRLDMIKTDIEGAEFLAIKGAEATIKKHKPSIVSEFSPEALQAVSKVNAVDYLGLLLEYNTAYKIYAFTGEGLECCDRNTDKVLNIFDDSQGDHINILFSDKEIVK